MITADPAPVLNPPLEKLAYRDRSLSTRELLTDSGIIKKHDSCFSTQ
jgi:hypothetical protein